jgi:hypothetical protein
MKNVEARRVAVSSTDWLDDLGSLQCLCRISALLKYGSKPIVTIQCVIGEDFQFTFGRRTSKLVYHWLNVVQCVGRSRSGTMLDCFVELSNKRLKPAGELHGVAVSRNVLEPLQRINGAPKDSR